MDSFAARFPTLPLSEEKADRAGSAPTEASDETLLSRIADSDEEALTLLFRRHASLARGIGRRILRDEGEAEDLVQEVFLHLYDKAGVFDSSRSSARSWIVQVIYYQAIARRRYLSSRHCQDRLAQQGASMETPVLETEDRSHSEEALFSSAVVSEVWQTLTEAQRETLRLFFFEGYTLSEISAKLSESAGNVRHHYYRGLDRLRSRLSAK
jgi:RNA polymerase sigma-70 factor (ECF subfamily)